MKVIICGANGAMGKLLQERFSKEIAGLVSIDGLGGVPRSFGELGNVSADTVVDFSHHSAAPDAAAYAVANNCALVVGTTGHTEEEKAAILATHTANTSIYSFAAEVEYHARFLMPILRIRLPFFGKSIYESAIRADMTIDDGEFEGPAPFHRHDSKIVKRQIALHGNK